MSQTSCDAYRPEVSGSTLDIQDSCGEISELSCFACSAGDVAVWQRGEENDKSKQSELICDKPATSSYNTTCKQTELQLLIRFDQVIHVVNKKKPFDKLSDC